MDPARAEALQVDPEFIKNIVPFYEAWLRSESEITAGRQSRGLVPSGLNFQPNSLRGFRRGAWFPSGESPLDKLWARLSEEERLDMKRFGVLPDWITLDDLKDHLPDSLKDSGTPG